MLVICSRSPNEASSNEKQSQCKAGCKVVVAQPQLALNQRSLPYMEILIPSRRLFHAFVVGPFRSSQHPPASSDSQCNFTINPTISPRQCWTEFTPWHSLLNTCGLRGPEMGRGSQSQLQKRLKGTSLGPIPCTLLSCLQLSTTYCHDMPMRPPAFR